MINITSLKNENSLTINQKNYIEVNFRNCLFQWHPEVDNIMYSVKVEQLRTGRKTTITNKCGTAKGAKKAILKFINERIYK